MTMVIHSVQTGNIVEVNWALNSCVYGGLVRVDFSSTKHNPDDMRVLAEVFVLERLITRFPGKAPFINTSLAQTKKLMRGDDSVALPDLMSLVMRFPKLKISSSKKLGNKCQALLSQVAQPETEHLEWSPLPRPSIASSIGTLELTYHAFLRFKERFSTSARLCKVQQVMNRNLFEIEKSNQHGVPCSIFSIPELGLRAVVSTEQNQTRRILTFTLAPS
jgi:hypothetical protein